MCTAEHVPTLLELACSQGHTAVAEWLVVTSGIQLDPLDSFVMNGFLMAVENGFLDIIVLLKRLCPQLNIVKHNDQALWSAVENGCLQLVQELICWKEEQGCATNYNKVFAVSVTHGHLPLAKWTLDEIVKREKEMEKEMDKCKPVDDDVDGGGRRDDGGQPVVELLERMVFQCCERVHVDQVIKCLI